MYRRNPYLERLADSNLFGLLLFTFGATVVSFTYEVSSPWLQLFIVIFFAAEEAFLFSRPFRSMRESVHRWVLAHPAMRPTQPWDVSYPWLVNGIAILVLILILLAELALFSHYGVAISIFAGSVSLGVLVNVSEEFFRRLSATEFPVSKTW